MQGDLEPREVNISNKLEPNNILRLDNNTQVDLELKEAASTKDNLKSVCSLSGTTPTLEEDEV